MKALIISGAFAALACTNVYAQSIDTLKGSLTSSRTLNASTCYVLEGCYQIQSGGSLTLPAGTTIRALPQASLIVRPGGQIFANGASGNPVVFTYAELDAMGNPSGWTGMFIAGQAITNQVAPSISNSCAGTISYGGSNDADNSGVLQHLRIEYAGVAATGDPESAGLNLLAVGTGTTIDHVQVSYSKKDAYDIRGGKVDLNYMESLNSYRSDMQVSQGYTGNIQFLTSVRLDANAHDNSGVFSNGIYVFNDATGSINTPKTHPVISNATFFGPRYCGVSPVHSDFRAAVRLALNAEAEIYNSVFTGWNTGLQIVDASTINNANVNGAIKMDYNTFYANAANFANTPAAFNPLGAGCANTITDWMTSGSCQIDNFIRTSLTGYSNTLCGDFCSTPPVMTLSATNNVGSADYSWDAGGVFTTATYRGSLTNSNWSSSWSNWCPKNVVYCPLSLLKQSKLQSLRFLPNPAANQTLVQFESEFPGQVQINLLDKVTGSILRSEVANLERVGVQQVSLSVSGLTEGVYPVQVRLGNGQTIGGQLTVQ